MTTSSAPTTRDVTVSAAPADPAGPAGPGPGKRVVHIALTGGPCAGKTSALSYLTEQLSHRGWRVLTTPEAATLLITGGVADIGALATHDRPAYLAAQRAVTGLYLDLHRHFHEVAHGLPESQVVVLHDRGVPDNAAYMDAEEYGDVLAACGLNPTSAAELYDAVLHLRSAAVAREDYDGSGYTRDNNVARQEDAGTAAALDAATLAAWASHPHLNVVSSNGSFTAKLSRTLETVLHVLGDPHPLEIERKFLLRQDPDLNHPILAAASRTEIEQVYLPAVAGAEQRVRARTLAGVSTYTHAAKTDAGAATRIEIEQTITEETYRMLRDLRDPQTVPVRKTRRVFVVGDQRFELDHVHFPREAWLLEAELVNADDELVLPDFLRDVVEVTHDRTWRNRALAEQPAEAAPA